MTNYEWEKTLEYFGGGCALNPESKDVQMAHFIPLEWKIGGTYMGNIIPLDKELNQIWSRNNPMLWLSHGGHLKDHGITLERRDRLIDFVLSFAFPGREKLFDSHSEIFEDTFYAYKNWRMSLVQNYPDFKSKQLDADIKRFHSWLKVDWENHSYYKDR